MSDQENIYDIGDQPILTVVFTDATTKERVDPEVVVCTVRPPKAPASDYLTPTVSKVETGVYRATIIVDRSGRWWYAFDGAGNHQGAEERSFTVRSQNVPR